MLHDLGVTLSPTWETDTDLVILSVEMCRIHPELPLSIFEMCRYISSPNWEFSLRRETGIIWGCPLLRFGLSYP